MGRVLAFLVAAAVLIAAAWYLAHVPGEFSATVGTYGITLPTPWAILALLVAFAVVYVAIRLLALIVRLPRRTRRLRMQRDRVAGDKAVTQTLLALAGGDAPTALRAAGRSRTLLGDTPQTLLLAAYAGRQAGRPEEADTAFNLLAGRSDAAFLGLRGLMQGAVARGDWEAARVLADQAEQANPGAPWLRAERAKLATRAGNWKEALALSGPGDSVAVLGTAASDAATDTAEARRLARDAWRADKGFVPAALAYARRLREAGQEKRAQTVLRESWAKGPHPALAEAALGDAADPAVRGWRVGGLAGAAPSHPESYFLRAQAELAIGNTAQARREAEAARAAGMDNRRLWRLMAAIADREGDPAAAAVAFRQAAEAPPDPQWRCGNCGTTHVQWHPRCDSCGAVGTIAWGDAGPGVSQLQLVGSGDAILP